VGTAIVALERRTTCSSSNWLERRGVGRVDRVRIVGRGLLSITQPLLPVNPSAHQRADAQCGTPLMRLFMPLVPLPPAVCAVVQPHVASLHEKWAT